MSFKFDATGIGSVPFKDPKLACRIIFDNFQTIPFWPQLQRRSFLENMYAQFSERLPGIVIDEANKSIHLDTTGVAETIEEVYQNYLDNNVEFFKISERFAAGFYEFLNALEKVPNTVKYVKGHIVGPISYALSVTDENKKAIIHDRDLFELLTKTLVMKARWQIRKLKKLFPSVIIFIDEPYLVSIGSSFVNINREEAFGRFDEVVAAIKSEGALAGVHCCGNTDWPLLLDRGLDILNFDAYNFAKEFSLYASDVGKFLEKPTSTIAWGIVPSSEEIEKTPAKALAKRLESAIQMLADKGISRDISSIITPSCGVGLLEEGQAKKILETARELSGILGK